MPYLTEKLSPEKYQKDLKALIGITKPAGIITFGAFIEGFDFLNSRENSIKSMFVIDDLRHVDNNLSNSTLPGISVDPGEIVLLQHSSGTTGLQKGVALSHRAVLNQLDSYCDAISIDEEDVIVSWLPLYHDMGLIAGFLLPILYGFPLVLMSPFDWVKAPQRLMEAITNFKGSLCWLPNFAYNFCAKKVRDRHLEGVDLSSMRAFINCSETMRKSSHDLFLNRYRKYGLKETSMATCYAMAENVFAVTQGGIKEPINYDEIDLKSFQETREAIPPKKNSQTVIMVSGGRPIKNTEVRIIDSDGKILSDRKIGEIVIRSDCMLTEYYNRRQETMGAFTDGWFKTGDLGYLADGELYISGRKKDLIIVGGKNIYPKDLEIIAMDVEGVHPGRVVAFGIFNELEGTEDVVIIAEAEDSHAENKKQIAGEIRRRVTQESAIALRQVLIVEKKWL